MSLADDIERFRLAALGPIQFELDAIDTFTTYMRRIDDARRDAAEGLAEFFSSRALGSEPRAELAQEPPLSGPWPGYDGQAPQPYAPPPPPNGHYPNGNGGYPATPPPVRETPMREILDGAHQNQRRPR